jgi:hypothetical protein
MEGFTSHSSTNTKTTDDTTTNSSATLTLTDEQKEQILSKLQEKSKENTATTTSSSAATEGFDIIGTENSIKRGKQSNSIPVNSFMKNSDAILPFGGFDSYSMF